MYHRQKPHISHRHQVLALPQQQPQLGNVHPRKNKSKEVVASNYISLRGNKHARLIRIKQSRKNKREKKQLDQEKMTVVKCLKSGASVQTVRNLINYYHYNISFKQKFAIMIFIFLVFQFGVANAEKPLNKNVKKIGDQDNQTRKYSTQEIFSFMSDVCRKKPVAKTPNKAVDVLLGSRKSAKGGVELYPQSCIDKSKSCGKDLHKFKNEIGFSVKDGKFINQQRELAEKDLNLWQDSMPFSKLALTKPQLEKFQTLWDRLHFFKRAELHRKFARKYNMGKCGEHNLINIDKIRRYCKRNGVAIKMHRVAVNRDGFSHEYLIINSDLVPIKSENPKEIAEYFKLHKKGHICDSWNEGIFEEITKNKNDLYTENAEWKSLSVVDVSPQLDFSGLPIHAIDFLNQIEASIDSPTFQDSALPSSKTCVEDNAGSSRQRKCA